MRTRSIISALSLSLLASCIHRHPLTTSAQAKLLRTEGQRLHKVANDVQAKIHDAGTLGALILDANDSMKPIVVLPTNDPITGAASNAAAVQSAAVCIYAFREDTPIPPQTISCAHLMQAVRTKLLIDEHDAAIKQLMDSLGTLHQAYERASESVGQNNKRLDKIIADLNGSLSDIRARLDDIKRKVDDIR